MIGYKDDNSMNVEEVDRRIQDEISRQRDNIAIGEWQAFEKSNPEIAAYIKENHKRMGCKIVTIKTEDGRTQDCCIPNRKSEEELRRTAERSAKFHNKPTPEEYLDAERAKGSTALEDHILEQYVDEFYDLG